MLRNAITGTAARGGAALLCAGVLVASLAPSPAVATEGARPAAASAAASPVTARRKTTVRFVKELVKAWRITKGQGVTVAIIGGRVDPHAPGLSGKVRTGPAYGKGHEYDATPLASAVAGSGPSQSNPTGTVGLAPAARILSLQVSSSPASGTWFDNSANAISYAARHGAKVILFNGANLSDEPQLDLAVSKAVASGAVIVSEDIGWGKKPNQAKYPESLPGVVTAGTVLLPGLTRPPRRSKAALNDSVLVSAPGNVLSVTGAQGAGYIIFNQGSSVVWVTATVALVKSLYPHLSPALVEQALVLSATDRPRGGYSHRAGYGLVNPVGALHEAAKLRKLSSAARSGTVSPSARLAGGPAPGVINAVRHPLGKLAGLALALVAGLLVLARVWTRRSRRRLSRHSGFPPATEPAAASPQFTSPYGLSPAAPSPYGSQLPPQPYGSTPEPYGSAPAASPYGSPPVRPPYGSRPAYGPPPETPQQPPDT